MREGEEGVRRTDREWGGWKKRRAREGEGGKNRERNGIHRLSCIDPLPASLREHGRAVLAHEPARLILPMGQSQAYPPFAGMRGVLPLTAEYWLQRRSWGQVAEFKGRQTGQ